MSDWVHDAIQDRLQGTHIHVDPLVAVEGLSMSEANKRPFPGGRSPHELLYHIVYWLEYSLDLLDGTVDVHEQGIDWETGETRWEELVDRFSEDMSRLGAIAENRSLDQEVKVSDDLSTCVGAEILGAVQHTSYHLGQVVTARRALGLWPRK
ncbi:DinB family protein [Candidatus Bathyarchaeota archaeon]|nr:DinB family protein [Candidatus Bathyarchaeota archaeon]